MGSEMCIRDRLEPDATVTEGLRAGLGQAEESLGQWLNDIGL